MSEELYKIIFKGEIFAGYVIDEVKKDLSNNFKLDHDKLDMLFSGRSFIIAKNLDYQTAMKYKMLFEKAGAICKVYHFEKEVVKKPDSPSTSIFPNSGNNISPKMICPKCGAEQPESPECLKCGVIIKKYLERKQIQGQEKAQQNSLTEIQTDLHSNASVKVAESAGIDLKQEVPSRYDSKEAAEKGVESIQHELPQVESSYKPSGRLPVAALIWMFCGTLLGIPAGAISGAIAGILTVLLVLLLMAITAVLAESCGVIWLLPILLIAVVAFAGFFITYIVIGAVPAAIVAGTGQLGKNRNVSVPVLLSIASAFVAVVVFRWPLVLRFLLQIVSGKEAKSVANVVFGNGVFGWICIIVGFLTTCCCAAAVAANQVKTAKFCEDCEEYMKDWALASLSLGGAIAIVKTFEKETPEAAVNILNARSGNNAIPTLFACPICGKGYLEVNFKFSAKHPGGKNQKEEKQVTKEWLIGSWALTDSQVALFKRHMPKTKADRETFPQETKTEGTPDATSSTF